MARPKKKGVDYFPHDCITGKTIFILEQKFGNDGYAFWFKLLEFLGTKEGHYLDCNDLEDMEFLQAKTKLSKEFIHRILDLLSNLKAIDPELWQKKVVWSNRFVEGISVVYSNRKLETPRRPDFYIISTSKNPSTLEFSEHPTSKSTQRREEYSIEENSREEESVERGDRIDSDEILNFEYMSKKNETSSIPLPFDSTEFSEKWAEWLQYRKERKLGAYAPTGLKSTFTKLKKISHDDPAIAIEVIEQSLANGWQGLFELKQNFNAANISNPSAGSKAGSVSRGRIQAAKDF